LKFNLKAKEPLSLNVTPLIDVVFLLLIFFMTTTTFDKQTQLEIQLPAVDTHAKISDTSVVEIVINSKGLMEVDHHLLPDTKSATLREAIKAHPGFNPTGKVIISADAQASHQSVMRAMDVAGGLGYSQIELRGQLN
jgi:biopolymer transport protein ExbD